MEITLIRHGRSKHIDRTRVSGNRFSDWVELYNQSGVFEEEEYPSITAKKISEATIVITSDLKRAIQSAEYLRTPVNITSSSLFRETELPTLKTKMKLSPQTWAVILRLLWFMGLSTNCESYNQAKLRAEKAAEKLMAMADEHTRVVLVGHGFFNLLVAKRLLKQGWQGKRKTSSKHWGSTTYIRSN